MTRVKICGITGSESLTAAASAGADAVGLLCDVTVDTPREVSSSTAADLAAGTPPFVSSVLVTMAAPPRVEDLVAAVQPDAVQLHGYEDPAVVAELTTDLPANALVAVDADEPSTARAMAETADGLVLDSVDADGAGGTGHTHDWEETATLVSDLATPVVLAGGLSPDNVADAVETVAPYAVDVSTGVETAPGEKDPAAIEAFVTAAKRAEVTTP